MVSHASGNHRRLELPTGPRGRANFVWNPPTYMSGPGCLSVHVLSGYFTSVRDKALTFVRLTESPHETCAPCERDFLRVNAT